MTSLPITVRRDARDRTPSATFHLNTPGQLDLWFAPAVLHTARERLTAIVNGVGASSAWTIGLDRAGRLCARVFSASTGGNELVPLQPGSVPLLAWSELNVQLSGSQLTVTSQGESITVEVPREASWEVSIGAAASVMPGVEDESFVGVLARDPDGLGVGSATDPTAVWSVDDNAYDDDGDRPRWHFLPPTGWMNEPHGILHFQGRHHLFYQRNERGPFWGDITWGHAVSDNLIDWDDLGSALEPSSVSVAPDGIWSGSAALDADGEPVLFFTAGDNDDAPNQRTAIARPADPDDPDLRRWTPSPAPVTRIDDAASALRAQGRSVLPDEFRDPYVWTENGRWYQIVGGGIQREGGTAFLYQADEPTGPWAYRGPLFVGNERAFPATGVMWELPSLVPVQDGDILRHALLVTPWWPGPTEYSLDHQWYWLGDWDADRGTFIPDNVAPRDLDLGGYFTGATPSRHPDGRVIIWSITQDLRGRDAKPNARWAGHAGAPIELRLVGTRLVPRPIAELEALRESKADIPFESGHAMVDVGPRWDTELRFTVDIGGQVSIDARASEDGEPAVRVKVTRFDATFARLELTGPSRRGARTVDVPLHAANEIAIRILADHSAMELFVENTAMLTTRAWSKAPGEQLKISVDGPAVVTSAHIYPMRAARMRSRRESTKEEAK